MTKVQSPKKRLELREAIKLLRRVCECGETFARHGAPPPHDRWSEDGKRLCRGFREQQP